MHIIRVITVAAALGAGTTGASATLVNIDFGVHVGAVGSAFGGAAGQAGTWNEISTSGPTALADTSGASLVGLALTFGAGLTCYGTAACGYSGVGPTGASATDTERLVNDNFYAAPGVSWSFTIAGLADGLYDVYYYSPSNQLVTTGTFSINGVGEAAIDNTQLDTMTLTLGVTHGKAAGISVTGGTMSFISTGSTSDYRGLAGLQLVSATSVPEPATFGLVALALLGLSGSRGVHRVRPRIDAG
jgi:hypothetical protein